MVSSDVSVAIADAFRARGYDAFCELRIGIEDPYSFKKMLEFNPHVMIKMNYLRIL